MSERVGGSVTTREEGTTAGSPRGTVPHPSRPPPPRPPPDLPPPTASELLRVRPSLPARETERTSGERRNFKDLLAGPRGTRAVFALVLGEERALGHGDPAGRGGGGGGRSRNGAGREEKPTKRGGPTSDGCERAETRSAERGAVRPRNCAPTARARARAPTRRSRNAWRGSPEGARACEWRAERRRGAPCGSPPRRGLASPDRSWRRSGP